MIRPEVVDVAVIVVATIAAGVFGALKSPNEKLFLSVVFALLGLHYPFLSV